jgi:hypothetical protein
MPKLYKRVATVTIGGRQFESPPFHLEFSQKIMSGVTNITELKLFNPNQETQNVAAGKTVNLVYYGPQVSISAGYEEDSGMCCLGQASGFEIKREHSDVVLTMKISDATAIWRNTAINKSYRNQMASFIIRDMISISGLNAGSIVLGQDKLMQPAFVAKRLADALTNLCWFTKSDLIFYNGLISVTPKKPTATVDTFLLSSSTGLVGIPEKTAQGIKFQTLFIYKLGPNSTVQLDSTNIKGRYSIFTGKKNFSTARNVESEWEARPL